MTDYNHLWLDTESTGLEDDADLLEIAMIVADPDGQQLAKGTWCVLPNGNWSDQMVDVVHTMHTTNGLISDVYKWGRDIRLVEGGCLNFIDPFLVDGKITPCGSGILAFDIPRLRRWMPDLSKRFTYFGLDVGVVRRMAQSIDGFPHLELLDEKPHRALPDTEFAWMQWGYYRGVLAEGV